MDGFGANVNQACALVPSARELADLTIGQPTNRRVAAAADVLRLRLMDLYRAVGQQNLADVEQSLADA